MKLTPILFSGPMVRAILDGRKTQTRRIMKPQPRGTEYSGCAPAREYLGPTMLGKFGAYFPDFVPYPFGQPGDRLWVRETWCEASPEHRDNSGVRQAFYRANSTSRDGEEIRQEYIRLGHDYKWKPSIFMPRWASRITLEVTGVRVARLQDIDEADAIAEGCTAETERPYDYWEGYMPLPGGDIHGNMAFHTQMPVEAWPDGPPPDMQEPRRTKGSMGFNISARNNYRRLWESINGPGSWDANPWVWVIEFKRVEVQPANV